MANDPNACCDCCDNVTPERAAAITKIRFYEAKIDEKRVPFNNPPIDYSPKINVHRQMNEGEA